MTGGAAAGQNQQSVAPGRGPARPVRGCQRSPSPAIHLRKPREASAKCAVSDILTPILQQQTGGRMARLDEEQQAALRKFKQEALGVEPAAQPLRATTSSMTFADRSSLPVPAVAKIVGCQVSDVLMILRQIGSAKKSSSSGLTVGEAEAVRDKWNASSSSAARPTLPLGLLAAELEVDLHLLAIEARRAGIPVQGEREAFTLFEVEADHLRRFAARWPGKLVRAVGPAVGGIRTSALTRNQASVDGVKAPTWQNRPSTASAITGKLFLSTLLSWLPTRGSSL